MTKPLSFSRRAFMASAGAAGLVAGFPAISRANARPVFTHGVQSGDVLTIDGRGITPLRGSQRGDLRVGVQVVTPTKLDSAQRALIEDFAKKTKAPAPKLSQFQQGLFSKLRDRFRSH